MPKTTRRQYRMGDGSRFERTDSMSLEQLQDAACAWDGCQRPDFAGLGLCFDHAARIYGQMHAMMRETIDALTHNPTPTLLPAPPSVVYYLMVGPATVKIGTTTNLRRRIAQLRTELQYVVAVERGGRDLERQRHQEFMPERIGIREDFRLSDRLKAHIEALQPHRDDLVAEAS